MPYRPIASFRKNIKGVIYPLTEAVRRIYGHRSEDGAYPLGAFYPINVSSSAWHLVENIWYVPAERTDLDTRNPREETVVEFMQSISTGEPVELPSGITVTWERIPESEASYLPNARL